MNRKILWSWFLVFCLLFTGCNTPPVQEETSKSVTESKLEEQPQQSTAKATSYRFYYDSSDSFHPFQAKTQTQCDLFPLIYDGLIKVSPEYKLEYQIAKSVKVSGNTCRVTLKEDTVFSDGTFVTPKDVIDSLEMAMQKGSLYAAQLSGVKSIQKQNGDIVIELKKANRFFAYNLDVPIIKSGVAEKELPVGCGRYVLHKKGNSYSMKPNVDYGSSKKLLDIELSPLKSNESRLYAVKTGAITAYVENSAEDAVSTTGTWTTSVNLNHLVFLGINPKNSLLSAPVVRQAILLGIDNSSILTQAYGSQGITTNTPVNPQLTNVMEYDFSQQEQYNPEKAKQILEEAGYHVTDTHIRTNDSGKQLSFNLMINKNNSSRYSAAYLISGMLETIGIEVKIEQVSFDEYAERIASGDFDLYLGETRQKLDSSLDVFLTGAASSGISKGSKQSFYSAANAFLQSPKGEKVFFDTFFNEVPMVPLLYRNGLMIYSKSVHNTVITAPHDMFYNIADWV